MAKKRVFRGRLIRVGAFFGLAVPAAVSRALGDVRGHVPVVLQVEGAEAARTSLLPNGRGGHLVYVNAKARKPAGIGLGDWVNAELSLDRQPRGEALPEDLATALRDEGVLEAWSALPPGRREQLLRWIDEAVHEATRAKRLARAVEQAQARREKLLDKGMC
jgi:hypothetical protein